MVRHPVSVSLRPGCLGQHRQYHSVVSRRRLRISSCLVLLFLFAPVRGGVLQIHCLNVGQGDATLVIAPSGRTLLVDAGYDSLGLRKVLPWLASRGITNLDWIVATHYHGDHIGGLDEVILGLGRASVKQAVYDRGWSYGTNAYSDYVRAAGPKRRTITDGMALDLGDGVVAHCLAVNGNGRLRSPFTDPPWDEKRPVHSAMHFLSAL